MYPNIRALISILCTLPVTSCSAERRFSGLRHTKTAFWSSMTTQRLYGLTHLHVHRDISIDIAAAVDDFSRCHPRRMQMVDIPGNSSHQLLSILYPYIDCRSICNTVSTWYYVMCAEMMSNVGMNCKISSVMYTPASTRKHSVPPTQLMNMHRGI